MGVLEGKTALVTGGGRGIGRAIALRYAREGAHVAIADLNEQNARAVADEVAALGVRAVPIRADVTRAADIRDMVRRTVAELGRIDVLANNAGVIRVEPLLDVMEEQWDFVMDVNAKAAFFVLQAVARQMKE